MAETMYPRLGRQADGRLSLFAANMYFPQQLLVTTQTAPNSYDSWTPWSAVGGLQMDSRVEIAQYPDGTLDIFAVNQDQIWHARQLAPNGGWDTWKRIGAPAGTTTIYEWAVAQNFRPGSGGYPELFVNTGRDLQHAWLFDPPQWVPLGVIGGADEPAEYALLGGVNQNGIVQVFGVDSSATRQLSTAWQDFDAGGGEGWVTSWYRIGGTEIAQHVARSYPDSRLHVFTIDETSGGLSYWAQNTPNGYTDWSSRSIGGNARRYGGNLATASDLQSGEMYVFTEFEGGQVMTRTLAADSTWTPVGTVAGQDLVAGNAADGTIMVFARTSSLIFYSWKTATGWAPMKTLEMPAGVAGA